MTSFDDGAGGIISVSEQATDRRAFRGIQISSPDPRVKLPGLEGDHLFSSCGPLGSCDEARN